MTQSPSTSNDFHKQSLRAATMGIIAYFILATAKLVFGSLFASHSLRADGLNNLSDVISSLLITLSIYLSSKPADSDHRFGHQGYETLASFIASILMLSIGFGVIKESITNWRLGLFSTPDNKTILVASGSVLVLGIIYLFIRRSAKKTKSIALKATAKDMANDIFITLGTIIGTIGAIHGYPQIDSIVSIAVGIIIMISGIQLFLENSFVLSDGFDQDELKAYRQAIINLNDIHGVRSLRARVSGQLIFVDVTIEVPGRLTVTESHHITEQVEQLLKQQFHVYDVDVHVEPYNVPIHLNDPPTS